MRLLFCFSFLVIIFFNGSSFANFENGEKAYNEEKWVQAIYYLRPLAEKDDTRALVLLGNMYSDGKGVKKSEKVAYEHYKRAAKGDNVTAIISLATQYIAGIGTKKDFNKAVQLFNRAAHLNSPEAQFALGLIYLRGDTKYKSGIKKDLKLSFKWFSVLLQNDTASQQQKGFSQPIVNDLSKNKLATEDIIKLEAEISKLTKKGTK